MTLENKLIVLRTSLTEEEFNKSAKIREKVDEFTTKINDRLCDKFKEEIMFDAIFYQGKMIFTVDSPKAVMEVDKTINKLLDSKKYQCIANRLEDLEEKTM